MNDDSGSENQTVIHWYHGVNLHLALFCTAINCKRLLAITKRFLPVFSRSCENNYYKKTISFLSSYKNLQELTRTTEAKRRMLFKSRDIVASEDMMQKVFIYPIPFVSKNRLNGNKACQWVKYLKCI